MNQEKSVSPKKVLFLITKATWGGAQRYVYDLATHLPKDAYRPVVAYGEEGRLKTMLYDAGIEIYPLKGLGRDVAPLDDITSFSSILKCIREIRPDVVHLNSSKAAALGALAARFLRVRRIVFTVHGWPFKEDRGLVGRALVYFVSWFTALCAHRVIVVSREDETLGKEMWLIADKIQYVPLGIEVPKFLSHDEAIQFLREQTSFDKIAPQSTIIGTIAELTPNKGIRFALEALAHLHREADKNYIYVTIGDGEERMSLEDYAHECGIADKVFFLGFVPDASRYLHAFDIFLLPSIKEGTPYVLLEAGESGVPIITTSVVDQELSLRYTNLRHVPPRNGLAIADAILSTPTKKQESPTPHTPRSPLSRMVAETLSQYS